jgi:hypothetical protein
MYNRGPVCSHNSPADTCDISTLFPIINLGSHHMYLLKPSLKGVYINNRGEHVINPFNNKIAIPGVFHVARGANGVFSGLDGGVNYGKHLTAEDTLIAKNTINHVSICTITGLILPQKWFLSSIFKTIHWKFYLFCLPATGTIQVGLVANAH